ncbi:MAG: hypothetical protein Q8R15_03960 [Candidatus Micrarchaeota archaeon]|nr:hypothetical protein [Candidatus Micrarchaeota archaeon]
MKKKHSPHNKFLVSLVLVIAIGALLVTTDAFGVIGKILYFQSAETTCVETDGGNNPAVFSTLNISNSSGTRFFQDRCSSTTNIVEYYCDASYPNSQRATYSACPSGQRCSNGACAPITYICTDSDGGQTPGSRGTVTVTPSVGRSVRSVDSCNGALVNEYYCTSSTAPSESNTTLTCPTGRTCLNGRCILPTATYTCVDSDGVDSTVAGNVTITSSRGTTTVRTDGCFSGTAVFERTCSSPTVSSASTQTVYCPSGQTCAEGRCVAPTG